MAITVLLEDLPSRTQDQDTHDANCETLFQDLPTWGTQANALAAQANADAATATAGAAAAAASAVTADAAADVALAAANYAGLWSSLVGALNTPASVYHLGEYWVMNSNLADVTAKVPGTDIEWQRSSGFPTGGAEASSNVTLTVNSAAAQILTPTAYGYAYILPDATTMTEGPNKFALGNGGGYPVKIFTSTMVLKGFIPAGQTVNVSLVNNATAAGVWGFSNTELVGGSARYTLAVAFNKVQQAIDLENGRELLLLRETSTSYPWGIVYDETTNAFGTPVNLRAAGSGAASAGLLIAANTVLFAGALATAFEACTLSITGTSIVVNGSPGTATLSANISGQDISLTAVGSSYIVSYGVTSARQLRAMTVSGTTVTVGSATVLPGSTGSFISYSGSGAVVVCASWATSNVYVTPYTISGSTAPAVGTGTTNAVTGAGTVYQFTYMASGRWAFVYLDNSTVKGGIATLASTTITNTLATLFAAGTSIDAMVVSSTRLLVLGDQTTANANHLNDSAGTASAGTAITLSANTVRQCLYLSGTTVYVQEGTTTYNVGPIDCSGTSPVSGLCLGLTSTTETPTFGPADGTLRRSPNGVYATGFAQAVSVAATTTVNYQMRVHGGHISLQPVKQQQFYPGTVTNYRGKAANEIWQLDALTGLGKVSCAA